MGTSGYSYDDWVGPVYPPGTGKRDFLRLYSQRYPIVELNFSFYTQPTPRTLDRMVEVTPDGFLFAIKAHRSLTHEIAETLDHDVSTFRDGIAPLLEARRLAAILLQFPYSFGYTPEARQHLAGLCDRLSGLPLVVEFRKSDWMNERVFEGLRERGVSLAAVDEPDLPRLIAPSTVVTGEIAYVRFHGRNKATWWTGDNVSRYDYLYQRPELEEWADRIKQALERARIAMLFFNNHPQGKAAQNAVLMHGILQERGLFDAA